MVINQQVQPLIKQVAQPIDKYKGKLILSSKLEYNNEHMIQNIPENKIIYADKEYFCGQIRCSIF